MTKIIILNQIKDKNKNFQEEKHKFLNTKSEWIENFFPTSMEYEKNSQGIRINKTEQYVKELTRSFNSNHTHAGAIYSLHYCWGKELGYDLRPDIIFFTIISELAREIKLNPNEYKYLFSNKKNKKQITVYTNSPNELNMIDLTDELKKNIINKEIFEIICETHFNSETKNTNYANKMTFSNMITPYFSYCTNMCGIKYIKLGQLQDWINLHNQIEKLHLILPRIEKEWQNCFSDYLKKCINLIENIIYFGYNTITNNLNKLNYNNSEEFFNDVFHYGKNEICFSGHDYYIVQGWFRDFYNINKWAEDLYKFPTHLNFVPYKNLETERMFVQVVGLSYSTIEDDLMIPDYGFIKYEILDKNIYNKF